ncbi:Rrf2 family transcriptional regulator [Parapedobacter koreensis]|uniref:Transcriptional regulator, BadM/Rrf2 family n=1 Tax=Parapedobacter koreensis TaxID=332977 RepID=A0A1H7S002_9SPHI|nr:Rrf2 family transcriptional regulator [Parapedobacter koreensis]SEL65890.1 transcriptional regulator, BadM/Rrf2 family [Parapedobacter koreensis]
MNNTRFATVVHILAMLADNEGEWLSSDWIASSININPVMVRKELGLLQERGLVVTRKGKEGGSMLQKNSAEISLADVYALVKNADVLGKKNLHTNPNCPIGKQINSELGGLFAKTDGLVSAYLQGITLDEFVRQFR